MDIIQTIVLALMQGLTEFLPISSSAHLILVPKIVQGWDDQGLAFDVAVHVGTLCAVVIYFRKALYAMTRDWIFCLIRRQQTVNSRLAWAVLFGTIPVGLAGLIFKHDVETYLRSPVIIALASIFFGLLLWWSDVAGKRLRTEHTLSWIDVFYVGCAQALALIPGTSRSGVTMTAGLLLGLTREASARFSFLLSIPVIALSGSLVTIELIEQATPVDWESIIIGGLLAGLTAYLCIHFFLKMLNRIGMFPFVVYRVILGFILLYYYV